MLFLPSYTSSSTHAFFPRADYGSSRTVEWYVQVPLFFLKIFPNARRHRHRSGKRGTINVPGRVGSFITYDARFYVFFVFEKVRYVRVWVYNRGGGGGASRRAL